MSAFGQAASGNYAGHAGVDANSSHQKDLAKGLADLAQVEAGGIEYVEDKISPTLPGARTTASAWRIAQVKCYRCGANTEIHQIKSVAGGDWNPSEHERLNVFGWLTDGSRWYCGANCHRRAQVTLQSQGGKPVVGVERINDASYAKKMYATDPAVAAKQETTPAAPPQASVPQHNRPKR